MKHFFSCIIFLCFFSFAFYHASAFSFSSKDSLQGIVFIEQDWNKALQQAKEENKLVFLDIYATWCGPCKLLKSKTFTNAAVGEYFNKNFINISIDGEKGIGPQLARTFGLQGYPTLIVLDNAGKPLLYTMGYLQPSELLDFAKAAMAKKPAL